MFNRLLTETLNGFQWHLERIMMSPHLMFNRLLTETLNGFQWHLERIMMSWIQPNMQIHVALQQDG